MHSRARSTPEGNRLARANELGRGPVTLTAHPGYPVVRGAAHEMTHADATQIQLRECYL